MNTYHAFYKSKKIELQAETSYVAQKKAAELFKTKKTWEVTIILVSKDNQPVTHIAID